MKSCVGHGSKRRKYEEVIAALLSSGSIPEAAQKVNLHPNTLRNWEKREEFQEMYRRARQEVLSFAFAEAQKSSLIAMKLLRLAVLDSKSSMESRIKASRALIDYARIGMKDEDFDLRITRVEERCEEMKETPPAAPTRRGKKD